MNKKKYFVYKWIIPLIGRLYLNRSEMIRVIYYHDVVLGDGGTYDKISFENFKKQMNWLLSNGYETLKFGHLEKCDTGKNKVLITFDDGWRSNYEIIFDFMKENGIYYNIFLSPGLQQKEPKHYLTWQMIDELSNSGWVGFGAHTYDHIDARSINSSDWNKQIEKANLEIYNHTGQVPKDFCFPYGLYNHSIVNKLAKYSNYSRLYTSEYLTSQTINDIEIYGRTRISDKDTLRIFKNKIEGNYDIMGKLKRGKHNGYKI